MAEVYKCSRRRFIKSTGVATAAVALGPYIHTAKAGSKELNWLTYAGHSAKDIVGPFEEKHGVTIRAKEYSGGERMLSLIHGSPKGTFDVVTSDAPYVDILRQSGLIQPLDPHQYPFDDFWPEFQHWSQHWLDGKLYAVMSGWGFNGLAYNADVLKEDDVSSYKIMWREDMKGKVGMREWYLPVMGCFSLHLGNKDPYNVTNEQFEELKKSMYSVKPQVKGFWGFSATFDSLANGGAYVIPGTGDWMTGLLLRDGHNIRSTPTKEGAVMWTESESIVSTTTKKDLAREFIRYLVSPAGQMHLMTKKSYMASGPNKKAWQELNDKQPKVAQWINMDLKSRNLMDMLRDGEIVPRKLPANQSMGDWEKAYTHFKEL